MGLLRWGEGSDWMGCLCGLSQENVVSAICWVLWDINSKVLR